MKPFKNLNIKLERSCLLMTAPLRVLKNKTIHTIFVKGQNGLPLHAEDRLSSYPTKVRYPSTPPHKNVTFLAKA